MTDADVISDKPILFTGSMVRAILEGRKTQTRRIMKPYPEYRENSAVPGTYGTFNQDGWNLDHPLCEAKDIWKRCPYGIPGGRLWVRENIYYNFEHDNHYYEADRKGVGTGIHNLLRPKTRKAISRHGATTRTVPSIHMPKSACRLFLKITDIRVERLQDINGPDVLAEGAISKCCDGHLCGCQGAYVLPENGEPVDDPCAVFKDLWDSINGKKEDCAWTDNPYVWCLTFKRIDNDAS